MNKQEFINVLATKVEGVTKTDLTALVNTTFETLVSCIVEEGKVYIPGLGTFEVKEVEERNGRNPQTGETIVIPAHGTPRFKPAKGLKDAVR